MTGTERDRETDRVGGRVRAGMRREKRETKRCKRYTDSIIERDNETDRSSGAIQRERSGRERERERERARVYSELLLNESSTVRPGRRPRVMYQRYMHATGNPGYCE